jgi:hypothetical protein
VQYYIFEDFSYTNTEFPITGDSTNSLYGKNIWLTRNGKISSRAWHRYSWSDLDNFGSHSGIKPSENGITLFAEKGFRFGQVLPMLKSGFLLKEGTYVTRMRCSGFPLHTTGIQAFWLFTPSDFRFTSDNDTVIYLNEVDFEFNNWFSGHGEKRVHAGTIGAHHSGKASESKNAEMRFFQQNDNGQLIDLGTKVDSSPEYYFENRWYYYLIRLDSSRNNMEFLMESAEEGNIAMEKVYAGSRISPTGIIAPTAIQEYYPSRELTTVYNFGLSGLKTDSLLKDDIKMDVDWFYFTPSTNAELSEILKEIEKLQDNKITRINTSEAALQQDLPSPHIVHISGADTVSPGQIGRWKVVPSLKNTLFDIQFSYRLTKNKSLDQWIEIHTPELPLKIEDNISQIEFRAVVTDYWTHEIATASKIVRVLP